MARPRKAEGHRTVPVSCRLGEKGVAFVDGVAHEAYGGVRTGAVKALLALGSAAWARGERPKT